jgi:hypothetical protein
MLREGSKEQTQPGVRPQRLLEALDPGTLLALVPSDARIRVPIACV